MSGLSNLGGQDYHFGKSPSRGLAYKEESISIPYREEPKGSRASTRNDRDELDRLV